MRPAPSPTSPADPRLVRALRDELTTTLAAFRPGDPQPIEALLPLYAEQLAPITDVQELRLVFSIARQRATTYAPTPGEVREILLELRRRRSHAPRGIAPLPPAPRFDDAERWLAANPWAETLVEQEVDHLTRDWPRELASERARFLPVARLLVFNRCAAAPASARTA